MPLNTQKRINNYDKIPQCYHNIAPNANLIPPVSKPFALQETSISMKITTQIVNVSSSYSNRNNKLIQCSVLEHCRSFLGTPAKLRKTTIKLHHV